MEPTATRPQAPKARSFRIGRSEWVCLGLCLWFLGVAGFLVYLDGLNHSSVSNRSFAFPAFGLAASISSYAAWRLRSRGVFLLVFGWLTVTFVLYLGFGLTLILLSAAYGELIR